MRKKHSICWFLLAQATVLKTLESESLGMPTFCHFSLYQKLYVRYVNASLFFLNWMIILQMQSKIMSWVFMLFYLLPFYYPDFYCELVYPNLQREKLVCLLCLERIVHDIIIIKRSLINCEENLETHAGIASDK